jgi:hypothetical protein
VGHFNGRHAHDAPRTKIDSHCLDGALDDFLVGFRARCPSFATIFIEVARPEAPILVGRRAV